MKKHEKQYPDKINRQPAETTAASSVTCPSTNCIDKQPPSCDIKQHAHSVLLTLSGFRSEATPQTYADQFPESNPCGVIRAAILTRKTCRAWSEPTSRSGSLSVPRSRSPGHEEEHYGPRTPPSSQNGPFPRGLDHIVVSVHPWRSARGYAAVAVGAPGAPPVPSSRDWRSRVGARRHRTVASCDRVAWSGSRGSLARGWRGAVSSRPSTSRPAPSIIRISSCLLRSCRCSARSERISHASPPGRRWAGSPSRKPRSMLDASS